MLVYDVLHKEAMYPSIVSDLRNFGVKYRFKKSAFKTERIDGIKNSKRVFKIPLSYQPLDVVNLSSGGIVHVPVFVSQATSFIGKYITQEGLFRKAGSQLRQKELITRLDNGVPLGEKHHVIDVASCLKTFFRELPEPLIPYSYHDLFIHCAMLKDCRVQATLLACILLPPHHLNTLAFFMEFLKKVSLYEKHNKMTIDNLAKVIGPNVMPLQETTMSAVQMRLELHLVVVKTLIENAERIGILPDHISQAISMETIGSTDNELDVSESQSRSKSRKKKHRSGSLTRKPHLSASHLNLRMFNGLRKIVGKGGLPEDNNVTDNQRCSTNNDALHATNIKSTKKRKVIERSDPPSIKKKRVGDKTDKSKKIRLSLDRFVPRAKPKIAEGATELDTNNLNSYTERRWSSASDSYDSQRNYRTYSDGSSQLQLILKDSQASNTELQTEYNNMFIDADVNLSDDGDEQVLLGEDHINTGRCGTKSNSNLEEFKTVGNADQIHAYMSKKRMTLNDFEAYSHIKLTSTNDDSDEYVTISKSEYEDIKNRVSAIESRLSQEFGCVDNDESDSSIAHSVNKVQTAYEKTLEESRIESTVTADYLARKLGKELKIRGSGEHKIIRSPSARKIGSLRRRSQEKIMSKRVRRTASWHISHGLDLQSKSKPGQRLNGSYTVNEPKAFSSDYMSEDMCLQSRSTSLWDEEKNKEKLSNIRKQLGSPIIHAVQRVDANCDINSTEIQSSKNGARTSVRRVSSFHGNEFINTAIYLDEKLEKLKKTNSQQNIILNDVCLAKHNSKSDSSKKSAVSWKDAEGYFKTSNHVNTTPVTQTGRASIAKLRTQNAGMVLAKAKLFDECTTKVSMQSNGLSKGYDRSTTSSEQVMNTSKHKEANKQGLKSGDHNFKRNESSYRKGNRSTRSKNGKSLSSKNSPCRISMEMGKMHMEMNSQEVKTDYYRVSQNSDVDSYKICQISKDKTINVVSSVTPHQKENIIVRTPPLVPTGAKVPVNTIPLESRLSMYKSDFNALCRTPHIKKSLNVKTPKSSKVLVRKPLTDSRRTPLKAVGQLGTPKYQSPKSILKTRNLSRYA